MISKIWLFPILSVSRWIRGRKEFPGIACKWFPLMSSSRKDSTYQMITNYESNLISKSRRRALVNYMKLSKLIPKELKAPELIDVRRHPWSLNVTSPLLWVNAEFGICCNSGLFDKSKMSSFFNGFNPMVGTCLNIFPLKSNVSRLYKPLKVASDSVANLLFDKSSSLSNEQQPLFLSIRKLLSCILSI